MTDEIKKMLKPVAFEGAILANEPVVALQDFDRLKLGFLKLMEQRDYALHQAWDGKEYKITPKLDAELEAAMKGEET